MSNGSSRSLTMTSGKLFGGAANEGGTLYCGYNNTITVTGGQYLNACVWYEILTGNDCRENSYVSTYTYGGETYTLSDTMLSMLREAAHKAVSEVRPTYSENS